MTLNDAIAFRNFLATLIRKGKIKSSPEYAALDAAIHEAMAKPIVERTAWYHLDCAASMWRADARSIGR